MNGGRTAEWEGGTKEGREGGRKREGGRGTNARGKEGGKGRSDGVGGKEG